MLQAVARAASNEQLATSQPDRSIDLPSLVQCRCRKESICENGALLWHLHRIYRLDVLRRAGNASVSMCGFVP